MVSYVLLLCVALIGATWAMPADLDVPLGGRSPPEVSKPIRRSEPCEHGNDDAECWSALQKRDTSRTIDLNNIIPRLPSIPNMPELPKIPSIPNIPKFVNVPGFSFGKK